MFYTKNKIGDVTIRTEINGESVYTICLGCGVEYAVDLADILNASDTDLYGTAVYCNNCSAAKLRR